jgi:hypothetical protein
MGRLALPTLALAAILAALAPAVAGAAAVERAEIADKARNAERVGGIKASRRPRAGRLLPLGPGGRFPASVLANLVDSSMLQRPLTRACPAGQAIRAVSRKGSVTCASAGPVSAGTGLAAGLGPEGLELSVAPPLKFSLGASAALLYLDNLGPGAAIEGRSLSGFATAYLSNRGTGSALRADASGGPAGNAVSAYNYGLTGYAVRAELANGSNGQAAVYARTYGGGQAIDAEMNSATGAGDALYARSSSSNPESYAGYFSGNVNIAGTLTKSMGNFRIDHPLDPANRYLQHSFVESPDMKNIYDGIARTDGHGYATVRLPDWFGALNRDFRYQLTAIRSFARATVWRELSRNRFVIRTEDPGVKVSWQVTGIRDDAYARAHRTEVDIPKPPGERGRFLAAEELGRSARLQLDGR